jgi:phosphatidylserine decarboxylase
MVKDGIFYALALGVVAAALWFLTHSIVLICLPTLLAAFFLWFFRDPSRTIPQGSGLIVSPGDGVVTAAELIETTSGSKLRMSIFLNVFNVHVNRSPIAGTVVQCDHQKGKFLNAMNPNSSTENEQTFIVVDGGDYQVGFKQIAGLLARRIVCNLKVGDVLQRGQRMGLIKFGSRVDVIMPPDVLLKVKKGARVSGGSTILAELARDSSVLSSAHSKMGA